MPNARHAYERVIARLEIIRVILNFQFTWYQDDARINFFHQGHYKGWEIFTLVVCQVTPYGAAFSHLFVRIF